MKKRQKNLTIEDCEECNYSTVDKIGSTVCLWWAEKEDGEARVVPDNPENPTAPMTPIPKWCQLPDAEVPSE